MSGGSVGADILAYDSSNITIVGSGFAVDNVPVPDGPIAATSGVLTGTLESGEPIDNRFCHSGSTVCSGLSADGLITLAAPLGGFAASIPDWVFAASIPEPDNALLCSAALLSLAVLRARARSREMQITREP